jgi:hypothetical protein
MGPSGEDANEVGRKGMRPARAYRIRSAHQNHGAARGDPDMNRKTPDQAKLDRVVSEARRARELR